MVVETPHEHLVQLCSVGLFREVIDAKRDVVANTVNSCLSVDLPAYPRSDFDSKAPDVDRRGVQEFAGEEQ